MLDMPFSKDIVKNGISKYGPLCDSEGMVFQPIPIEILGGWHKTGAKIIGRIGQSLARANGQEDNEAVWHLFGKLSILLMRGNAPLILNRLPGSDENT